MPRDPRLSTMPDEELQHELAELYATWSCTPAYEDCPGVFFRLSRVLLEVSRRKARGAPGWRT